MKCPLCNDETALYAEAASRKFNICPCCGLIFLSSGHVAPEEQRGRYLKHRNCNTDRGYVEHLMSLAGCVRGHLQEGASGLDYGSGPAPVMSELLSASGVVCENYDIFFSPDKGPLRRTYDFITSCEVIEHFERPFVEFVRLFNLLKPGGLLGFKTEMADGVNDFTGWHYVNDITHVSFFGEKPLNWIMQAFGFELVEQHKGVVVLRKNNPAGAVPVVAGVIKDSGRYFAAKRKGGRHDGKWEFPGGKAADGEAAGEALRREFREEFGMDVEPGSRVTGLSVPVEGRFIELLFLEARAYGEPLFLQDHSEWGFFTAAELMGLDMAEGDDVFRFGWIDIPA